MKKIKATLAALGLLVAFSSQASALSFTESYLGTATDGDKWTMSEGYKAIFNFDLTKLGGKGFLKDTIHNPNTTLFTVTPTLDATAYDPTKMSIVEAILSFDFSDKDATNDIVKYTISINSTKYSLGSQTFLLGGTHQASSAHVDFDLKPFVSELQDGTLISLVVVPEKNNIVNNISLDKANYHVEAVPEPGTMVLLGAGLLSLAVYGKRRMNKEA